MSDYAAIAASINQRIGAVEAATSSAKIAAYVAAFAAIVALVNAAINSFVLWRNGFIQTRASQQLKHAEFRQAWINALRDDMAKFLGIALSLKDDPQSAKEAYSCMSLIMLRMNRDDPNFKALMDAMSALIRLGLAKNQKGTRPKNNASSVYVAICQKILKTEWETTRDAMLEMPPKWRTATEMETLKQERAATSKSPVATSEIADVLNV